MGMIGLGTMGRNLLLNMADNGFSVPGYDKDNKQLDLLTQEGADVIVADSDEAALRQKASKWRGTIGADLATAAGVDKARS